MVATVLLFAAAVAASVSALDNGLARTPPMGWLAWERFRCNVDCVNDPDNCISEKLFMKMADLMAEQGYLAAGYDVVSLDDCWPAKTRDSKGALQPDPDRFPSGLKALGNYIHSKGLKFGIYQDYGTHTCAGYPGVMGHLEQDANSFAEWGVDYVKLDGCYADPKVMDEGYPAFGKFLNKTGRPMVYSCSWPVYQIDSGMKPNWTSIMEHCNLWRNGADIQDSWGSVTGIMNYFSNRQDEFQPLAAPGHWNDPDMLIIGNFGLSYEQSKAQMAIWAVLAAPLLMSVDLRTIRPEYKEILLNKEVIAVNQDPLGKQGRLVIKQGSPEVPKGIEVWTRPITPVLIVYPIVTSYAVVFLNRPANAMPTRVEISLKKLGLTNVGGYDVTDLFDPEKKYDHLRPDDTIRVDVNPSGGVVMLRFDV